MTHIAIQESLDGSPVTWMEQVSDAEYLGGLDRFRSDAKGPSRE
jgi:hypothetical protein